MHNLVLFFYGDVGLFWKKFRALEYRHRALYGNIRLFCGDIRLFGGDTGLCLRRYWVRLWKFIAPL